MPGGGEQIAFYDKGVGTGGPMDRIQGGAFGRGLEDNIRDGYRFLAHNYEPGDEIHLFGFSRGAFTARSLAGFIGWAGLLPKGEMRHLPQAWESYRNRGVEVRERLRGLSGSREARIRCVGVWDTVGALGVPRLLSNIHSRRRYRFHDTTLGPHIDYAFHALAIDESRGPFHPTLWQQCEGGNEVPAARVRQVWFPGVHSNVGGGYPDAGLSDIALDWMIRAVAGATGLSFEGAYRREHVRPDPLGTLYDSLGLYAVSRAVPFRRILGQHFPPGEGLGSWIGEKLKRRNRPDPGNRYVNEMIHRSALERLGQKAPVLSGGRISLQKYGPANLLASAGRLPVVEYDGGITLPAGGAEVPEGVPSPEGG